MHSRILAHWSSRINFMYAGLRNTCPPPQKVSDCETRLSKIWKEEWRPRFWAQRGSRGEKPYRRYRRIRSRQRPVLQISGELQGSSPTRLCSRKMRILVRNNNFMFWFIFWFIFWFKFWFKFWFILSSASSDWSTMLVVQECFVIYLRHQSLCVAHGLVDGFSSPRSHGYYMRWLLHYIMNIIIVFAFWTSLFSLRDLIWWAKEQTARHLRRPLNSLLLRLNVRVLPVSVLRSSKKYIVLCRTRKQLLAPPQNGLRPCRHSGRRANENDCFWGRVFYLDTTLG